MDDRWRNPCSIRVHPWPLRARQNRRGPRRPQNQEPSTDFTEGHRWGTRSSVNIRVICGSNVMLAGAGGPGTGGHVTRSAFSGGASPHVFHCARRHSTHARRQEKRKPSKKRGSGVINGERCSPAKRFSVSTSTFQLPQSAIVNPQSAISYFHVPTSTFRVFSPTPGRRGLLAPPAPGRRRSARAQLPARRRCRCRRRR